VIKLSVEKDWMTTTTWSELYQLNRAHCGYHQDFDIFYLRAHAVLSLNVTSGTQYCHYWLTSLRAIHSTTV